MLLLCGLSDGAPIHAPIFQIVMARFRSAIEEFPSATLNAHCYIGTPIVLTLYASALIKAYIAQFIVIIPLPIESDFSQILKSSRLVRKQSLSDKYDGFGTREVDRRAWLNRLNYSSIQLH